MTVLCGGGTSSARTSFGLGVTVGTGMIAALLNNVPTPQAVAMAAAIGVLNYELSAFCTTDPPAMPTFTAQDYFNLLGGGGTLAQLAAADKFRDAIGNIVWPTFCQCDLVATPAPPTMPTAPTGNPSFQPPQLPGSNPTQPCSIGSATFDSALGVPTGSEPRWNTILWNDSVPSHLNTNLRTLPIPLPASIIMESVAHGSGATPATIARSTVTYFNSAMGVIAFDQNSPVYQADNRLVTTPPAGAVFADFQSDAKTSGFLNGTGTLVVTVTMFCSGQSVATPSTPCCPPDPSLEAELQAIRGMLDLIYQGLPTAVHSYADGASHVGLSGNGTITLSGAALGIRVNITTDPSTLGESLGDPNYLFDRGFVVPVVNAAPIRAESRLVYNPQMFVLPTLTEQIGYSLHPGVVVTIAEILRGP